MLCQDFLYSRRIEVQAVHHVPEIGLLVPVTALRFKPVGVDAVIVGKHLHPDGDVVRMHYQLLYHIRIISAVNLVTDFIFVLIEEVIHILFVKVIKDGTFLFQFRDDSTDSLPFGIAVPHVCLFPQMLTALAVKAFLNQAAVVVKIVIIVRPYQRIGRFHQGFDEIQCQCFLFIHFCYLCTAGFLFPYIPL